MLTKCRTMLLLNSMLIFVTACSLPTQSTGITVPTGTEIPMITGFPTTTSSPTIKPSPTATIVIPEGVPVEPFQDVRGLDFSGYAVDFHRSLIETFWFNESTRWPGLSGEVAQAVLEEGKNPGLGVRSLHEMGITGEGVSVAIIDQNLVQDHPEFRGKIAAYFDVGTGMPSSSGSMHGPAVASLLVGENTGTAPGARLYFAAAPSWYADAQDYADALEWIIATNETLPAGEKIRVVSVSAAPSGAGSPFTKNNLAWDLAYAQAMAAGILVLDCTQTHGVVSPCYYDLDDPENVARCIPGWPGTPIEEKPGAISAPTSLRTSAEEYDQGVYSYQYTGVGGLSWGIPYVAGVLALGWQVRPDLDGSQMLDLLFETAYTGRPGAHIIDPVAFVRAVQEAASP